MGADAATLLALAGVRAGETVVVLGDALLARSAAAGVGDAGRALDDAGDDADAAADRCVDGRLAEVDAETYARVLRDGGRLALAAYDDPAPALRAAGFTVVHATEIDGVRYVAATRGFRT